MSIAFPRLLPSCRIASVAFEVEPQEAIAPEQGGRTVSVELGPALWRASFGATPHTERDFQLWRAWFATLRGSSKLFYGTDTRRKWPRAYRRTGFTDLTRAGGGAFDGTTSTWAVNVARDEIDLELLPAAFALEIGDYLDLRWDTSKRSLHRFVTDGNADVSGEGTWSIEPPVPTLVPGDAVVNFMAPNCTMVVLPGTASAEAELRDRRIAFEAKQHLEE